MQEGRRTWGEETRAAIDRGLARAGLHAHLTPTKKGRSEGTVAYQTTSFKENAKYSMKKQCLCALFVLMHGMTHHWVLKPHGCATPQKESFVFN
jgi:hypothetical protein